MKKIKPIHANTLVQFDITDSAKHLFGGDAKRMLRRGVHGDGSCFFHTICYALDIQGYRSQRKHDQVRTCEEFRWSLFGRLKPHEWARFLTKHNFSVPKWLAPLLKHNPATDADMLVMADNLCNRSVWADEAMIVFTSKKMDVNAMFFDTQLNKLYCGVNGSPNQRTLLILWVDKSHFELLCKNQNDPNQNNNHDQTQSHNQNEPQCVFDPVKDKEFIARMFKGYKSQCSL